MFERDQFYTVQRAANLLCCKPKKVYGLIRSGKLPATNTSTGKRPTWLIRADDFEAAFRSRTSDK